jgi:hypothetical protein
MTNLLMHLAAAMFLLVPTMLFVVPTLTRGKVMVPDGSLIRGSLAVVLILLVECVLWSGLIATPRGAELLADHVTFGLVGLVFNVLALLALARLAPSVLYVKNLAWALAAAAVISLPLSILNALLG